MVKCIYFCFPDKIMQRKNHNNNLAAEAAEMMVGMRNVQRNRYFF